MNTFNLSKSNFQETQLPHLTRQKKESVDKRKEIEERKYQLELKRIEKEAII